MATSRIHYPAAPRYPDGETDAPTHYRIWKERHVPEGEPPWCLDGVDDVGRFTADAFYYFTVDEAVESIPHFANLHPLTTPEQERIAA